MKYNPTAATTSIREARARAVVICIGVVIAYDECTELGQAGHHWSHVCTGMVRTAAELPHTAMEQSSWQSLVQRMWRSPFNFFDLFFLLLLVA